MATFASFIDSAANLSVSADQRTYTITGDWNWDGALDANAFPRGNDGITIIVSGSTAKLRCSAGASGTFGGYAVPIRIIEQSNAHTYPNDNGSAASPTDCRFVGVGTSVWDHIIWTIEAPTADVRSDFDVGRNYSGTFRGFRLVQKFGGTDTNNNRPFNHIYSSNLKLVSNPRMGYGYSIRQERNAHAMIIESNPNSQFAGLAIDNVAIPANTRNEGSSAGSSARLVLNIPTNTTFTLVEPDTATITESSNNTGSVCRLINPPQVPTRTNNWGSPAGSTMIIYRDQPFDLTGADATGTLYADSQAASNGEDVNTALPANGQASIRVRTHYSARTGNNSGGTWSTAVDSYRFHAVGLHFQKYFSGTTNISVGTSPTTRAVTLSPFALPDGTAATSKTSGAVSSAADIANALHTYEITNPTYPALGTRLAAFTNLGALEIATAEIVLDSSASEFISRSSNTITLQAASTGVSASNGIGLINLGLSYAPPADTLALINMPVTTSAGTSSQITINAHASEVVGVFKNDGSKLGNNSFASDGSWTLQISAADSLANTRIGVARAGYMATGKTIDISTGGSYTETFSALMEVPGSKYKSTANTPALVGGSIHTSASAPFEPGDLSLRVSNGHSTAFDVFKAYHDAIAASNGEGTRAPAFGRQALDITALDGQPGNVFLGPDVIFQRGFPASTNTAAFVDAFVYDGIGGNPVHDATANPIFYSPAVSGGGGGSTDLTEVNSKLDANKAIADVIRNQSKAVQTSLPLTFPEGSPLSPLCAVTGLYGQEVIRDVERRAYTITPSGVGIAEDLTGIHTFSGTNSHIDYSLRRVIDGTGVFFTNEIIVIMQARPTAFNADDAQALFSIGAMLVSIAPSSGSTASLRVGVAGAQDSSAELTLDEWNTIVFSVQQRSASANYPTIRLAVNGGAQEIWNESSNQIFAQIGASTENFRLGARSVGNNLSSGWIGEARAIFMHPNNTFFNYAGATGWDIPSDIEWDDDFQVYKGASLMDRTEGVAADVVEPIIQDIDDKTSEIPANTAAAVATRNPTSTASQNGNIEARLRWLTDSVNTTTPPTATAISTQVASDLTIPTPASIADAVWDELLSGHQTTGTAGRKLFDGSTHGADDIVTIEASDIWNFAIPATPTAGSAIAKLKSLVNAPTTAALVSSLSSQEIAGGVSRHEKERIDLAVNTGEFSISSGRIAFQEGQDTILSADLTDTSRTNVTIDTD